MALCSGYSRAILVPVFAATILAGCTKELTGPRIATLVIVSGGGQFGVIGSNLTQPLKVQALDQDGAPAAGVAVAVAGDCRRRHGHPLGEHDRSVGRGFHDPSAGNHVRPEYGRGEHQ